jgi:hypothetical protein
MTDIIGDLDAIIVALRRDSWLLFLTDPALPHIGPAFTAGSFRRSPLKAVPFALLVDIGGLIDGK